MINLQGKNILVTGGTGFIGKPLCQKMLQSGATVFVLTRSGRRTSSDRLSYISALSNLAGTTPDIIINLAGEPIAQRWTKTAKDRIWKSRIEMTAALIDYIKSSPKKPSLFISASAIGYYGTDEKKAFSESTAPNQGGGVFSQGLCAAWENEAVKAQSYGVRTVLLRIGAVLGNEGGIISKLLLPFRLGLGGAISHGQQWFSWIDREDLIGLILHIIATPLIAGPINATAPNPVSNLAFSRALAAALHRPCFLNTPAFVLRLAFGDMADEIMLEGQQVIPQKAIESGYVYLYPTIDSSLQNCLKKR